MKRTATVSSKNQITIPSEVRALLGIKAGEVLVFDVDTDAPDPTVTLRRYPNLDELAGSVPVPASLRGLSWEEIRNRAWPPEITENG